MCSLNVHEGDRNELTISVASGVKLQPEDPEAEDEAWAVSSCAENSQVWILQKGLLWWFYKLKVYIVYLVDPIL